VTGAEAKDLPSFGRSYSLDIWIKIGRWCAWYHLTQNHPMRRENLQTQRFPKGVENPEESEAKHVFGVCPIKNFDTFSKPGFIWSAPKMDPEIITEFTYIPGQCLSKIPVL
jgi:hypothetical protein